ncbi:hypothetical protein APY94_06450 [Thermococcus celericrescens]|uniref:Uncharacterized protein n=1 Tax=Thermococcus celericrescens TaxID=227598 RepID=A0A100XXR6_9EURY|nr:hypothetical protein [Thermococcus celericrescens]KUH33289.1 hypothetical protein APY94_06450 [Thermococcus celericrescens]
MNEVKRVSEIRIKNYYTAYRTKYPHKGIDNARRAALNWAIGIHKLIFGKEELDMAIEEYKKFIQSLE